MRRQNAQRPPRQRAGTGSMTSAGQPSPRAHQWPIARTARLGAPFPGCVRRSTRELLRRTAVPDRRRRRPCCRMQDAKYRRPTSSRIFRGSAGAPCESASTMARADSLGLSTSVRRVRVHGSDSCANRSSRVSCQTFTRASTSLSPRPMERASVAAKTGTTAAPEPGWKRKGRYRRCADDLAHVENRNATSLGQCRDALAMDGVLSVVSAFMRTAGSGQLLNAVRRCEPVPGCTAGPCLEPLEERELRP